MCVLGGGPAGAALAARLASLGRRVVVVERCAMPREHIGESLSPGVWPVLAGLGVREPVDAAAFPRTTVSRIRWSGPERVRRAGDADAGVTVDRATFDALLLAHAEAAGAAVVTQAAAGRPARAGDGWEVPVRGKGVVRARFVADATGRARVLGGPRARTAPSTLALHALWHGGPTETRIEALEEGWLWGAPLPGDRFRAMALVDTGLLRARGAGRAGIGPLLRALLDGSALFRDLGPPVGPVRACDATCFASEGPIDEHAVRVGEAAFTLDPLSSSGVQVALQTGLAAAAAVHTILSGGDAAAAIGFYADHQRHTVERHARTAAASYAERGGDEPFWRARASATEPVVPAPAPSAAGGTLTSLLSRPVRLVPAAALAPTPCLVGDHVEMRRALTHPALGRPVAFLGGRDVAPVVDALVAAPTLRDVLEHHRAAVPVAGWLAERGLLEPA